MPAAAAIPLVAAGIGAGGSFLSAKAAQPKNVAAPPPNALFPGQQSAYLNELTRSGIGSTSLTSLANTAKTGDPVDQGSFFNALHDSMGRAKDEGASALVERFGSRGLRSGSDLMKAGTDYELQQNKDFATILADYTRQAGESAANRKLQASSIGAGLAGETGLAMTPSATLVTGSPSGTGSALSAGATGIQQLLLMKSLFPDIFAPKAAAPTAVGYGA